MTLQLPAINKEGFGDLRQQFDSLIRDEPTPNHEMGQLPGMQLQQRKRGTLRLSDCIKKPPAVAPG